MKRLAAVLLFGFSCGIPLPLTASILQAWMVDSKVDLTVIGLFSLVGLPYTLKFLWAPLIDRYVPPFLGRRRGWMLMAQLALILGIGAMGFSNPASKPTMIAALALLIAFSSASQDIAVDAYNTELLDTKEYGLGSSLYTTGYRVALVVSGSCALILADHVPWKFVYLIMAAAMIVGVTTSVWAPEPRLSVKPPGRLRDATALPLQEFFSRDGAWEVLIFLILYKIDSNLIGAMTTPFMMAIGFTKTDIGVVTKGFGIIASIVGGLIGGGLMLRLGIWRSLIIFGVAQAASSFSFMFLARMGHCYPMMVTAIAVENVCGGMGTSALAAFMMSRCDKRYTATQYALISSFMGLSRYAGGAPSGFLAKHMGWQSFFLLAIFAGIPALLMLLRYQRWAPPSSSPAPAASPA